MESKMYSKIVMISITAFAIIATTVGISTTAFVNAFAQEGANTPEGMNNTMPTENATEWTANEKLGTMLR